MSDPFFAEIRIFGFNFPPRGWALCDGQTLPIAQNTALFSLLGTFYGGDGRSTFALPNIQGSVVMGTGQGPGLSPRDLGETGGSQTVTLLDTEMTAHTHALAASAQPGEDPTPGGEALGRTVGAALYRLGSGDVMLAAEAMPAAGGGSPHNNLQPYLTLSYCISLQGVYPSPG
jgi:microcystin-dependent protein